MSKLHQRLEWPGSGASRVPMRLSGPQDTSAAEDSMLSIVRVVIVIVSNRLVLAIC